MAKRSPPNPEAEDDVLKAVEAAEAADTAPLVIEEILSRPEAAPETPAEPELPQTGPDAELERDLRQDHPPQMSPPPPTPVASPSSGGFLGTALGGVVAAVAGYVLATFVPFPGVGTSDAPALDVTAEVQSLTARVSNLEAAPAPAPVPDPRVDERLQALESRAAEPPPPPDLGALTEGLAALDKRIAALEARPAVVAGDGASADVISLVDSLRAEIDAIRASDAEAAANLQALAAEAQTQLAAAEEQAAALKAEAEETARKALARSAVGRIQAAVESGAPFATALADLVGHEVPGALSSVAESGVPSRAALEESFAPAARAALDASLRADMGESWTDRLGSFLRTTTGARSLTPREGSDPDAVLSRAEAALRSGDLTTSLGELQGLPPEGQAAMADWEALARKRIDAIDAVATLSAAVEG